MREHRWRTVEERQLMFLNAARRLFCAEYTVQIDRAAAGQHGKGHADHAGHISNGDRQHGAVSFAQSEEPPIAFHRMERAKSLLQDTNMKINMICVQVGYQDAEYFCTLFKKITGVTPNQYRASSPNM